MKLKTNSEYLKNLYDVNSYYRNGDIQIISDYLGDSKPILVKDEFGILELKAGKLLMDRQPTIRCAIDPNEYFKNRIKKVYGDELDLSKVNYKSSHLDIKVTCKIHGDFEIDPQYLIGKRRPGCINCKKKEENNTKNNGGWGIGNWISKSTESKKFDSFKFYIIKCSNENEEFYKIGRTFSTIYDRFCSNIPYNYEIIQIRESEDGHKIYCLEKTFKRINKDNKYTPKLDFHGKQECFTKIIDINNGEEIN
jgi:hypothetical protein